MANDSQRGALAWGLGLLAAFVAVKVYMTSTEEQSQWVAQNVKPPFTNEKWDLFPAVPVQPVRSPIPDTLPPLESVTERISYE